MSAAERLAQQRQRLLDTMRSLESCIVAMSAGVDSTVVAKAAQLALGESALAVTATSASLAAGELDEARRLCELIGIRHVVVATDEVSDPNYARNNPDRCFHCKTHLYEQTQELCARFGVLVIVNGANVDDAGDYRPGMTAARNFGVRSPLAECGFTKADVRELARHWDLPVWDKPATPCLSSRIAYGEEVTPERLEMIDRAEQLLRARGLASVRVRYHRGDLARIEVPSEAVEQICRSGVRQELAAGLRAIGFKFVTVDLEGFRSGSLNDLLPLEALTATGR